MKHISRSKIVLILIASLFITIPVSAMDAPSMWMVQNGMDIDLMVNTSEQSSGINAWVHFDPECVNITDVDFTGSPWQPMEPPGWSHQGDYVIIVLTNFSGVPPGEYRVATMAIECVGAPCTSEIRLTHAEPIGIAVHTLTYVCYQPQPAKTTISIGDITGAGTLPIVVTDAKNAGAIDVTLSYNPDVVRVTDVTGGGMDCTYTNLEHADEGWIRIGAIQGANPGLSGTFVLANVTFKPVGSADGTCSLDLNVTTFKDATPDSNSVKYVTNNGTYTSSIKGDVNGDGIVDIADAAYIAKHVLGISGYENIDEDAADVTGDGLVDMADSMYLTKHVLGISGFEELR